MEEYKTPPVNDGKGLYDNEGLCNMLIKDCDGLVNDLINGQRVLFCNRIVQMVQKLDCLRKGIANDLSAKNRKIEELKRINDDLFSKLSGIAVEKIAKDGAENGAK